MNEDIRRGHDRAIEGERFRHTKKKTEKREWTRVKIRIIIKRTMENRLISQRRSGTRARSKQKKGRMRASRGERGKRQ